MLKTLDDPELKKEGRAKERRAAVRKIANEIFDFGETARRSLGRHWQPRTPAERDEFVQLFSDLLERSYISKVELYGGEKIQYLGDTIDEQTQAKVQTKLVTKGGSDIPIEYRMHKKGERWLVYDVIIEGVSLVANYRTQFNKIIQTSSYQELVKKMKTKQEELATADPVVNAVILAAGVARRLAPLTDTTHKACCPWAAGPLLARMLEALNAAASARRRWSWATAPTRSAPWPASGWAAWPCATSTTPNTRGARPSRCTRPGSACASPAWSWTPTSSSRASSSPACSPLPAPSALLVDRGFNDTGEEVKIYTRGDRVIALGKKVVPEAWDAVGEGVGFFKCGVEAAPELVRRLGRVIEESHGLGE